MVLWRQPTRRGLSCNAGGNLSRARILSMVAGLRPTCRATSALQRIGSALAGVSRLADLCGSTVLICVILDRHALCGFDLRQRGRFASTCGDNKWSGQILSLQRRVDQGRRCRPWRGSTTSTPTRSSHDAAISVADTGAGFGTCTVSSSRRTTLVRRRGRPTCWPAWPSVQSRGSTNCRCGGQPSRLKPTALCIAHRRLSDWRQRSTEVNGGQKEGHDDPPANFSSYLHASNRFRWQTPSPPAFYPAQKIWKIKALQMIRRRMPPQMPPQRHPNKR